MSELYQALGNEFSIAAMALLVIVISYVLFVLALRKGPISRIIILAILLGLPAVYRA